MAYSKVLVLALALGLASSAPQNLVLRALNTGVPGQVQIVRSAPAATVSHLTHNSPSVVRTVATPAVRTVQVAQPTVVAAPAVRTVQVAAPAVRTVAHTVPTATAVRTVATELVEDEEGYDPNPQYNFGYSISDAVTGDAKARQETRQDNVVSGSYSVAQPDGRVRTVEYTADAVNGFQARVTYDGVDETVINTGATAAAVVEARNAATVVAQPAAVAHHVVPTVQRTVVAQPAVQRTVVAQPAAVAHHVVPAVQRTVVAAQPTVVTNNAVHQVHQSPLRTVVSHSQPAVAVSNPIAGLSNVQLRSLLSGLGVQTIA